MQASHTQVWRRKKPPGPATSSARETMATHRCWCLQTGTLGRRSRHPHQTPGCPGSLQNARCKQRRRVLQVRQWLHHKHMFGATSAGSRSAQPFAACAGTPRQQQQGAERTRGAPVSMCRFRSTARPPVTTFIRAPRPRATSWKYRAPMWALQGGQRATVALVPAPWSGQRCRWRRPGLLQLGAHQTTRCMQKRAAAAPALPPPAHLCTSTEWLMASDSARWPWRLHTPSSGPARSDVLSTVTSAAGSACRCTQAGEG